MRLLQKTIENKHLLLLYILYQSSIFFYFTKYSYQIVRKIVRKIKLHEYSIIILNHDYFNQFIL